MYNNQDHYQNAVKNAIDHQFSGVKKNPLLRKQLLCQLQDERKATKKLSVGFVFCIILLLTSAVALAIVVFSDFSFQNEDYGKPIGCAIMDNAVYYSSSQGILRWYPEKEKPDLLISQKRLEDKGCSRLLSLFFTDEEELMLMDQEQNKIWAFHENDIHLVMDFSDTSLTAIPKTFKPLVYQDDYLFLLLPCSDKQKNGTIYRTCLQSGQIDMFEVSGIRELTGYCDGTLLALQRTSDNADHVITIDTEHMNIINTISSLFENSILGVSYCQETNALYAIINGILCVLNQEQWIPIEASAIPQNTFFYGCLSNGYIATALDGIQFIPFHGEDHFQTLTIRGYQSFAPIDHDFQLNHFGITIARQIDRHICAVEVKEAISSGDTTDLFLVKMDADIRKMIQNGEIETLSSARLTESTAKCLPAITDLIDYQEALYAIPSDFFVTGWAQRNDSALKTPQTIEQLLEMHQQWDQNNISTGQLYATANPNQQPWTKEAYIQYLMQEEILARGALADFSSQKFLRSLQLIQALPLKDTREENVDSEFTYHQFFSFRGLREEEQAHAWRFIRQPTLSNDDIPNVKATLYVYILNPNSLHKDIAIAYLEEMTTQWSLSLQALLQPMTAKAGIYPSMNEVFESIRKEQYEWDAQNGIETDKKQIDDRIAALKARAESWEVTDAKLEKYRNEVVPYLNLMQSPILSEQCQSGAHQTTWQNMLKITEQYLSNQLSLEECGAQLNQCYKGDIT